MEEIVMFSDTIMKVNRKNKRQKRAIVVTNVAVYNFKVDSYKSFQRRIGLQDLGCAAGPGASAPGLTALPRRRIVNVVGTTDFVLKMWEWAIGYDYRYDATTVERRVHVTGVLAAIFERLTRSQLPIGAARVRVRGGGPRLSPPPAHAHTPDVRTQLTWRRRSSRRWSCISRACACGQRRRCHPRRLRRSRCAPPLADNTTTTSATHAPIHHSPRH